MKYENMTMKEKVAFDAKCALFAEMQIVHKELESLKAQTKRSATDAQIARISELSAKMQSLDEEFQALLGGGV